MRKNGRQAKETSLLVDLCRLDRRDLVTAQALADDVQPARQRCIAKGAVRLARKRGPDRSNERFLWIGQLHLRFGKRSGNRRDRITGPMHGWYPPWSAH